MSVSDSDGREARPEPHRTHGDAARPRQSLGVELLGEYQGSGRAEPSYLLRRADGRMLELSGLLYLVTAAADGARDTAAIADLVSGQADRAVSDADVEYLVAHKLVPLGVLAPPDDRAPAPGATNQARPLLGFTVRARVLPSRLVRPVAAVLAPLFYPPVVVGVLGCLAVVDARLAASGAFGHGVADVLYQPSLLLVVAALIIVGAASHELGHAAASRYGGAEPGPIGVGIYLMWPAFSNDLTACYRLSRAGRLRADLGGIYFNGVFSIALAAGYWATGFRPFVVVAVWQHLSVLQQLVPLVRLDGYYVLSDLVGVPDLFAYLKPALARVVRGRTAGGALYGLAPAARRVVMAWAMITLPTLLAGLLLVVIALPRLVSTGWTSLDEHVRAGAVAARAGLAVPVLLGTVEVVLLVVPFVGLLLLAGRVAARGWRWWSAGGTRAVPAPAPDASPPLAPLPNGSA